MTMETDGSVRHEVVVDLPRDLKTFMRSIES